mgnify:CR=1 FL=1
MPEVHVQAADVNKNGIEKTTYLLALTKECSNLLNFFTFNLLWSLIHTGTY